MTEKTDEEKIGEALKTMEELFLRIVRSESVNRLEDPVRGFTFTIKIEIDKDTKVLCVSDL